jgi:hypothetical protein
MARAKYMQQLPAEYTGWLAAVRDPSLAARSG